MFVGVGSVLFLLRFLKGVVILIFRRVADIDPDKKSSGSSKKFHRYHRKFSR